MKGAAKAFLLFQRLAIMATPAAAPEVTNDLRFTASPFHELR
jgi:hypothetical protein